KSSTSHMSDGVATAAVFFLNSAMTVVSAASAAASKARRAIFFSEPDQIMELSVDRADDLARVHDVVGVERLLDGAHQRHRLAVLLVEELDLAQAHTVLAGAGAAERQRPCDEPVVQRIGALEVGRVVGIDHHGEMEVAIA